MTLQAETASRLRAEIERRAKELDINYSELGRQTGIHQSQVSRICNGNFRTFSHSVMLICNALKVDLDAIERPQVAAGSAAARVQNSAMALWDGTIEDADRIVQLLGQLSELRRHPTS